MIHVEENKGDTHYDLWTTGSYTKTKAADQPTFHLFLVSHGTVGGFKSHQNTNNKRLKAWIQDFDREKLNDDEKAGSERQ